MSDVPETNSSLLAHLVELEAPVCGKGKSKATTANFKHPSLSSISAALTSAMPHMTTLISRPDVTFSDTLIIQAVYLSLGPFSIDEPAQKKRAKEATLGRSIMKTLRVEALGCLRGVSNSG